MVSARSFSPPVSVLETDQRVLLHGMSWRTFERILADRGDDPVPRMAYLNGTIELMSPSKRHENKKTLLGMLVEAFVFETGMRCAPMGSTTLKKKRRGAEPDESYALDASKDFPDLAIEVALTSGGIDKLEIYRVMGVREVWIWDGRVVHAYELRGNVYEAIETSTILPGLAIAIVTQYAAIDDAFDAVRAFRASLSKKPKPRARGRKPAKKKR